MIASLAGEMVALVWVLVARLLAVRQLSLSAACWMARLWDAGVAGVVDVGRLTMECAESHSSSMWPLRKEAMRSAMVSWMLPPSLLVEAVGWRMSNSRWRKSHQNGVGLHSALSEAWAR